MDNFQKAYDGLNESQREAVDTIEGPLLVIAGPGTGKTQLLSARVAHILKVTDTLPQNILCLTFTETGASNMRDRLSKFIGKSAYDINIGTYHAFGSDIIKKHSEYFTDQRLEKPIDAISKHEIISSIIEKLSYSDPLKQTKHHLKDLKSTISEMKRALLSADDLRNISAENESFISDMNKELGIAFDGFVRMPRKQNQIVGRFEQVLTAIQPLIPSTPASKEFGSLAQTINLTLALAIEKSYTEDSTKPLTAWKDKWLAKNSDGNFILDQKKQNNRLRSLANVLELYQSTLASNGFFDFDDMIIKSIDAIKKNDDLKYTLQEKYQYILLDEYQDTNAAQAELVHLLTDNPVNEGRPNIMAVGDDDQAIYAFQGAQYSNMLDFHKAYKGTKLINLSKNYRSHHDIITAAGAISSQIEGRLVNNFTATTKELVAANPSITQSRIQRRDFRSHIAENDWVASQIERLINKEGADPKEIAVLAPKHKILESLVPYLQSHGVQIRYEKRENIIESPAVKDILAMCRLVVAIGRDEAAADNIWPAVLSIDCYEVPVSDIWRISWKVYENNRKLTSERTSWTRELLNSDDIKLKNIAEFFVAVSQKTDSESCEHILDYLTGTTAIETHVPTNESLVSPLRQYYLDLDDSKMLGIISSLTVLRSKLREHQDASESMLYIKDLLQMVDTYEEAGEKMLDTSPYSEADSAVQLMTVFSSKGLEFRHVFLMHVVDGTWGSSSGGQKNRLTLPANLAPTRHSGASEDEQLRLLFVAITRAKESIFLTGHTSTYTGKPTKRLKYLDEREQEDGSFASHSLPDKYREIISDDNEKPALEAMIHDWRFRHVSSKDSSLKDLLEPQLAKYQLSPTHLNAFCDLIYAGPEKFFVNTILRFPSSPGIDGEFGNAIHETLEWVQHSVTRSGSLPNLEPILDYFTNRIKSKKMPEKETDKQIERGHWALTRFIEKRGKIFSTNDKAETNFRNEGVFVGNAHMAGNIDRIEIDKENKTITVVDYKTGSSIGKWDNSNPKLHKYSQQLYCYKILVEGSKMFSGYTVNSGRLEFVEPDGDGECHVIEIKFNNKKLEETKILIQSMWRHVMDLDFPDTSSYAANITGIKEFEKNMVDTYSSVMV